MLRTAITMCSARWCQRVGCVGNWEVFRPPAASAQRASEPSNAELDQLSRGSDAPVAVRAEASSQNGSRVFDFTLAGAAAVVALVAFVAMAAGFMPGGARVYTFGGLLASLLIGLGAGFVAFVVVLKGLAPPLRRWLAARTALGRWVVSLGAGGVALVAVCAGLARFVYDWDNDLGPQITTSLFVGALVAAAVVPLVFVAIGAVGGGQTEGSAR